MRNAIRRWLYAACEDSVNQQVGDLIMRIRDLEGHVRYLAVKNRAQKPCAAKYTSHANALHLCECGWSVSRHEIVWSWPE